MANKKGQFFLIFAVVIVVATYTLLHSMANTGADDEFSLAYSVEQVFNEMTVAINNNLENNDFTTVLPSYLNFTKEKLNSRGIEFGAYYFVLYPDGTGYKITRGNFANSNITGIYITSLSGNQTLGLNETKTENIGTSGQIYVNYTYLQSESFILNQTSKVSAIIFVHYKEDDTVSNKLEVY